MKLDPQIAAWMARLNLVAMARNENDYEKALEIADQAYRDYPYIWETVSCKAELLRKGCGLQEALSIVREYADKHWWHCKAHIALGKLYSESGDNPELKQWAAKTLPDLKEHLSMAEKLK